MADDFTTGFVLAICLALLVWSVVLTYQDNKHMTWTEHVDDALELANPANEPAAA